MHCRISYRTHPPPFFPSDGKPAPPFHFVPYKNAVDNGHNGFCAIDEDKPKIRFSRISLAAMVLILKGMGKVVCIFVLGGMEDISSSCCVPVTTPSHHRRFSLSPLVFPTHPQPFTHNPPAQILLESYLDQTAPVTLSSRMGYFCRCVY